MISQSSVNRLLADDSFDGKDTQSKYSELSMGLCCTPHWFWKLFNEVPKHYNLDPYRLQPDVTSANAKIARSKTIDYEAELKKTKDEISSLKQKLAKRDEVVFKELKQHMMDTLDLDEYNLVR